VNIGDIDFETDADLRVIKTDDHYQIVDGFGHVLLETDDDDLPF
jgi:hypothetical protein